MYLLNFIPGYLGNKTKLLPNIEKEIRSVTDAGGTICDLFAGSGVISDFFKSNFNIISNDIEYYSFIINKVNINFNKEEVRNLDLKKLIEKLKLCTNESGLKKDIGDIEKYIFDIGKQKQNKEYFFYSNFSGTYFSTNQGLEIDFYRLHVEKEYNGFLKDYLIALGIYSLYSIVNSVGNHFAQPRQVKDKNLKIIKKKFQKSFLEMILAKHNDILENIDNISIHSLSNISENLDYKILLTKKHSIDTFYVDTPYTIDHYSRFYHVLNTFSKYDYPETNGTGLYRQDRYQSGFCLKTKVEGEFSCMISNIYKNHKANIVLSYSDSYRSLLHKDQILRILKSFYKEVKVQEIGYEYSGLGQGARNRSNELLFTAKII